MDTRDTTKIENKQPYKYGDIQKLLRDISEWHEKYRDAHIGATADGKDPITMVKEYADTILTTAIEEEYKRGYLVGLRTALEGLPGEAHPWGAEDEDSFNNCRQSIKNHLEQLITETEDKV